MLNSFLISRVLGTSIPKCVFIASCAETPLANDETLYDEFENNNLEALRYSFALFKYSNATSNDIVVPLRHIFDYCSERLSVTECYCYIIEISSNHF